MYQDVPSILRRLQRTPNVKLALASRTHAPGLYDRQPRLEKEFYHDFLQSSPRVGITFDTTSRK